MSRDLYRIYWDYYGPHAEKTAQHFHHHLDEMIEREGVTVRVTATGVESYTPLHSAAWCEADYEVAKQLAQRLKAKRSKRLTRSTPPTIAEASLDAQEDTDETQQT